MKKLENKIALVSASSKGIGFACAKILAQNGAKVYLGIRDKEEGEVAVKEILDAGGFAEAVYFDAKKEETHISMVEEVIKKNKKIDILVNNYGATDVRKDKDLVEGDKDAFFTIVEENLKSVYLPCKIAIPNMMENGGGSIVNISSIGSVVPDLSRIAYCVSKAGINSLTQNIATQYARYNIRCNAVLPGLIATDAALKNMSDDFIKSFLRHVPLNRMGKPEDIANAVLFYASDDSSFVTGDILEVAGGYSMPTPQYGDFI